jgi:putative GTP pyrophosphokinase
LTTFSKTQIDRLGDRLRKGSPSEEDLKLLDEYRRSFGDAYELVVGIIRDQLNLEPTGRPAKSTSSLVEKLHRESIRLSQVQDIAGCRVVVANVPEQERIVASLVAVLSGASVIDRRANPSYGYRAVHVIAHVSGKLVEIQIRTPLQHLWAELSEKFADSSNPSVKYGGGEDDLREVLTLTSGTVAHFEDLEMRVAHLKKTRTSKKGLLETQKDYNARLRKIRTEMRHLKRGIARMFNEAILGLEKEQKS